MTAIAGANYYITNQESGWRSVDFLQLSKKEQVDEISTYCTNVARTERCESAAALLKMMAIGAFFGVGTYLVYQISSLAIGIFALPLALIPPLYYLVCKLGGTLAGGLFGYTTFSKHVMPHFRAAQAHWNYANHLYHQGHLARVKKAELQA